MNERLCVSTATVGSSKKIKLGLCTIPQAIFKRRFNPPLNFFGTNLRNSCSSTNSIASCTYCFRCFASETYNPQKKSIFSSTVKFSKYAKSCGTIPISRRTLVDNGNLFSPKTVTSPLSKVKNPNILLIAVVFPQPFGPRSAKSSPLRISISK